MPKISIKQILLSVRRSPVMTALLPLGLAILSGILMSLAPAPLSLWWLAWVALVPFWGVVIRTQTVKPVTLAIAWGLAYHGLSLAWITGLHPLMWLGVPWLASIAIVAFAWSFITLWGTMFVCLWAWGMAWMGRLKISPWVRVLTGTALWIAMESIRQWSPLDWTMLAYTQSPHNLAILHLGQISGPMTVSAAIVAMNGLLAEAIADGQRVSGKFLSVAIAGFLGLHLVGFGLYNNSIALPSTDALKAGIVQGNVPTRIKLFEDGLKQAFEGYSTGYRSLVAQNVDFVVTPEGALPILWQGVNRTQNPVYQAILEKQVPAFLGTFVPQDGRYTQSLIALAGNGEQVGRYNKLKLVPLGEYLPFEGIVGRFIGRLSPIRSFLVPGTPDQQFETPFGLAAVGICYDSAFPEAFRAQVARGAQFLMTASNLDPYSTVLMEQHQAHDVMRSIETDRWAVRATNTGYSGIVDPHGRIQWRSQPNQYQTYAGEIYRRQTQTLYVKWGNWLTPTLLGISAVALVMNARSRHLDR